jgi:hypothetical protein
MKYQAYPDPATGVDSTTMAAFFDQGQDVPVQLLWYAHWECAA